MIGIPENLIDGELGTDNSWSNFYDKDATPLLPSFSLARQSDWVSVTWEEPQTIESLVAYFAVIGAKTLPAKLTVTHWDGTDFVSVERQTIDWALETNEATVITFDPVSTTSLRIEMTSPSPGEAEGFVQLAELEVLGYNLVLP